MGHDEWRKSKAGLTMLRSLVLQQLGEQGILAADLHNTLDYLDAISNPNVRGRMFAFARSALGQYGRRGVVYRNTDVHWQGEDSARGKVIPAVAENIGRELRGKKFSQLVADKEVLKQELLEKMNDMGVELSVRDFVLWNFSEILVDIIQSRA
ncbi:MAG: hypothetical protein JRN52_14020 [Nitrososphaerota archaeon]|nr:hypothetical protein [Nitrososphaerota archaeon]